MSHRYDSIHTHGTGCTLSSVIASALAIGHQQRSLIESGSGAARSIYIIDACCLAKAYVTAGVAQGVQVRKMCDLTSIEITTQLIHSIDCIAVRARTRCCSAHKISVDLPSLS